MSVKAGERVLVKTFHHGGEITIDGEKLLVVKDEDIVASDRPPELFFVVEKKNGKKVGEVIGENPKSRTGSYSFRPGCIVSRHQSQDRQRRFKRP